MAADAESIAASADSMAAVAEPIVMVQDNKPSISVHISYPNRNENLLGALINPRKIFGRVTFNGIGSSALGFAALPLLLPSWRDLGRTIHHQERECCECGADLEVFISDLTASHLATSPKQPKLHILIPLVNLPDAAVLDYSCIQRVITVSLLARIGHSNFATDDVLWTKDYPSHEGYNTELLTFEIEGFVDLHDNFNGFRTDSEKSGHGVSFRYLVCAVLSTVNGEMFKAQKELVILKVSPPPVINDGLTLFFDFHRLFHIKATLNKTHYHLSELIAGNLSYSLPYHARELCVVDSSSSGGGLHLQIHEVVSGVKVLGNERNLEVISDRVIAKYIHPLWSDPLPDVFPFAGIAIDFVTERTTRFCADTVYQPFTLEYNTDDLTITAPNVHGVFGVKYTFKLLLLVGNKRRVLDEAELVFYRGGV